MMRQAVAACLDLLQEGYSVTYHEGYPRYHDRIIAVCVALEKEHLEVFNYREKIEAIIQKEISQLNIYEVCACLTFIFRQERFCDGQIDRWIKNGKFSLLLQQYLFLSEKEDSSWQL